MTLRHSWTLTFRRFIVRAGVVVAILMTMLAMPAPIEHASAAPVVPNVDPNSVVPQDYRNNESWSEEGGWHWVTISYDGTQRFTGSNYDYSVGKPLPAATYVATQVRSLSASDSCDDCVKVSQEEEGPPIVMGGPNNPDLQSAYSHLDNGPRRVIDSANPAVKRWTKGTWYLNYSPISRTFFSWTWIPDDGGFQGAETTAEISTSVMPSLAGLGQISLGQPVVAGSRVFPIAGSYHVSQPFGCVPLDPGYASPSFCPPDRPSFHDGVDLAASAGTPILAAASGKVTFAGIDTSTASENSMIVIDHNGSNAGFETVYMHWEKTFVKAGDEVSAGQVIALVGSVGYSTGPHLHFSVRVVASNQTIEPLSWLAGSVQFATSSPAAGSAYANVMQWLPLIQKASTAHNVPAGLIAAIMAVESGGNPNAVSPAGALGLMQIMPDQLTRLGVPESNWKDPASNIDAGARYLAETLGAGGTLQDAVARYFGSGCDVLGTCTKDYVSRVLTLYIYFANWIETGSAPTLVTPAPVVTSQPPAATESPASVTTTEAQPPATSSPTPEATPTPTSEPTATPTPESTPTPPPAPTASSNSPTPTSVAPSPTPTTAPTPTAVPTPAVTPTPTPVASPTPTAEPAATPTPPAATPDPTVPPGPTPTVEAAETATPTSTPQSSGASDSTTSVERQRQPSATDSGSPFSAEPRIPRIIGPTLSELLPINPQLKQPSGVPSPTVVPTETPTDTDQPPTESANPEPDQSPVIPPTPTATSTPAS